MNRLAILAFEAELARLPGSLNHGTLGRTRPNWRAALTPLGFHVVARLRPQLEAGARIRWASHLAPLALSVQEPPTALLEHFAATARHEAGRYDFRAALSGMGRNKSRERTAAYEAASALLRQAAAEVTP